MTKTGNLKLPFGRNEENEIVHISQVKRGKSCNCFCTACSSPLIAVKGNKNQHHFRHAVELDCESGVESAVHLAAKQILKQKMKIKLPPFKISESARDLHGRQVWKSDLIGNPHEEIEFDSVQEEKAIHGMRADILAQRDKNLLIIEFYFRHKVDDVKKEKIKKANISAVEINLSDLTFNDVKDWDSFWLIINDPKRIEWINNKKALAKTEKLRLQLEAAIHEEAKSKLTLAMADLEYASSEKCIKQYKHEAEDSINWELYGKRQWGALDQLPKYLDMEVPFGDFIFGCDRRIWQVTFYSAFVISGSELFSIEEVIRFLNGTLRGPTNYEIIEEYGKFFPEIIPKKVRMNPPSPWETLRIYFKNLIELGVLKLFYLQHEKKNFHYTIINKVPYGF
jgi:hypothetical protein